MGEREGEKERQTHLRSLSHYCCAPRSGATGWQFNWFLDRLNHSLNNLGAYLGAYLGSFSV